MSVKRRIKALKKYQLEQIKMCESFYQELSELEKKYFDKIQPLNLKRTEIVNGKYEPTDAEADFKDPNAQIDEELNKMTIDEKPVTGVPSFWLTCLKNSEMTADMVQEYDEAILEHLTDITYTEEPDKFILYFHFSSNDYFSNAVLTKEYKVRGTISEEDPFAYDGPEILAKKGCKIEWKADDKNITQRKVTKKQKNKKTGHTRTVTKTVQADSFFNFFEDPEEKSLNDQVAEEAAFLTGDFELGQFIKERLIPKAVLFFTGELATDYDDYGDEDDFDEDDFEGQEDDVDSEADPDYKPTKKALRRLQNGKPQPECKQQWKSLGHI